MKITRRIYFNPCKVYLSNARFVIFYMFTVADAAGAAALQFKVENVCMCRAVGRRGNIKFTEQIHNVNFNLCIVRPSNAHLVVTDCASLAAAFLAANAHSVVPPLVKKSRSARLFAYKCAHNASLSLPTFCRFRRLGLSLVGNAHRAFRGGKRVHVPFGRATGNIKFTEQIHNVNFNPCIVRPSNARFVIFCTFKVYDLSG